MRAVGTVFFGSAGQSEDKQDFNKRNLSETTSVMDGLGNKSFDSASLRLDDGVATAVTHACSGGNPVFGGSATAGGFFDFNQIYQLTSTTLAPGTLVPVRFQFASHANVIATGTDLDFFNDSGGSGARVELNLATTEFTSTTLVHVNGGISRGYGFPNVQSENRSGNYRPDDGEGAVNFMLAVGEGIRLSVAADASASSTALGRGAIVSHSQLALVWGFDVMGDAILSTDDLIPMPARPASNGTLGNAIDNTPPPPVTIFPEPASLSLLACAGLMLLHGRRRPGRRLC